MCNICTIVESENEWLHFIVNKKLTASKQDEKHNFPTCPSQEK